MFINVIAKVYYFRKYLLGDRNLIGNINTFFFKSEKYIIVITNIYIALLLFPKPCFELNPNVIKLYVHVNLY